MSESNIEFKFINLPNLLFFQEGPGVRKHQFTNSGVKLINGGNINNNQLDLTTTDKFISKEEASGRYKHFLVDEGDLVIASSGVVVSKFDGKIAFVDKSHLPLCMNTSTIRFKVVNKTKCDIKYFYFFLKHNLFKNQIQRLITGSAQLNFGPTHLKKIKIPIPYKDGKPDLLTQKRIAKILSHTETLISKRKESIKMLDEFVKATFLEMFGDPVRNEKGWGKNEFEKYIEYIGDIGSNGSNAIVAKNLKMLDNENYALMVRTLNLKSNDFTSNVKYFSKETYDFFAKSKIFGGEIIMNKIGSAGEFWIMPKLNRPVSLGLNQLVIRLKNLNTLYLFHYLSTPYGKAIIKSRVKGAVTKSITKRAVKKLPILSPPFPLQNKFSKIVEKTEVLKKQFEHNLQELENLYGSLSQRAFKAELDLSRVKIVEEQTGGPEQEVRFLEEAV